MQDIVTSREDGAYAPFNAQSQSQVWEIKRKGERKKWKRKSFDNLS